MITLEIHRYFFHLPSLDFLSFRPWYSGHDSTISLPTFPPVLSRPLNGQSLASRRLRNQAHVFRALIFTISCLALFCSEHNPTPEASLLARSRSLYLLPVDSLEVAGINFLLPRVPAILRHFTVQQQPMWAVCTSIEPLRYRDSDQHFGSEIQLNTWTVRSADNSSIKRSPYK